MIHAKNNIQSKNNIYWNIIKHMIYAKNNIQSKNNIDSKHKMAQHNIPKTSLIPKTTFTFCSENADQQTIGKTMTH